MDATNGFFGWTGSVSDMRKKLLKGELKRKGLTYANLAEKLAEIGVRET